MSIQPPRFNKVEIERRRALLAEEAERRGLSQLRYPYARIWADPSTDPFPTHFFIESYFSEGDPELVEYELHFPITNFSEYIEVLRTLDQLYFATVNTVSYQRHGVEGLIEFLEELTEVGTRSE